MVVPRREVLVQLDDDLVRRLDEAAKRHATNRSELLRRGAVAVLTALDDLAADRDLREAYRRTPQDPSLVDAVELLSLETWPEW